MFSSALGRDRGYGALNDFEEGLLDPLSRYISGDGDVFSLFRYFIYFIDVDNAPFRCRYVVAGV